MSSSLNQKCTASILRKKLGNFTCQSPANFVPICSSTVTRDQGKSVFSTVDYLPRDKMESTTSHWAPSNVDLLYIKPIRQKQSIRLFVNHLGT